MWILYYKLETGYMFSISEWGWNGLRDIFYHSAVQRVLHIAEYSNCWTFRSEKHCWQVIKIIMFGCCYAWLQNLSHHPNHNMLLIENQSWMLICSNCTRNCWHQGELFNRKLDIVKVIPSAIKKVLFWYFAWDATCCKLLWISIHKKSKILKQIINGLGHLKHIQFGCNTKSAIFHQRASAQ